MLFTKLNKCIVMWELRFCFYYYLHLSRSYVGVQAIADNYAGDTKQKVHIVHMCGSWFRKRALLAAIGVSKLINTNLRTGTYFIHRLSAKSFSDTNKRHYTRQQRDMCHQKKISCWLSITIYWWKYLKVMVNLLHCWEQTSRIGNTVALIWLRD